MVDIKVFGDDARRIGEMMYPMLDGITIKSVEGRTVVVLHVVDGDNPLL